MRTNLRKCGFCGEAVDIANDKNFIRWKTQFMHGKCFIQRQTSLKKGKGAAWTKEMCEEEIRKYQETESKNLRYRTSVEALIQYLSDQYSVSFFPSHFYVKMQSIYDGTFKGLKRPVSPEHLLEMWQTKIGYLNKINVRRNQPLEGINRINYDLAVLLSKYDRFLEWKEVQKQELESIRKIKDNKKDQINYAAIQKKEQIEENNLKLGLDDHNKIDIHDILDEI